MSTWDGVLDLNEQDVVKEDCRYQAGRPSTTELLRLYLMKMLANYIYIYRDKSDCRCLACRYINM